MCRFKYTEVFNEHYIIPRCCSSHWATHDHRKCGPQHLQYPFRSNEAFPSLDDRSVLATIITWNTQYPARKLQRDSGISLFLLCHCSAPTRCQPTFKHTDRLWNVTRSRLRLARHLLFLQSVPLRMVSHSVRDETATKGKDKQQIFHLWSQRVGCFCPYHAENLCWGCFSELINTTKTTGRMQPCSTKVNLGGT